MRKRTTAGGFGRSILRVLVDTNVVLTRNTADFAKSPVPALDPAGFLASLAAVD